MQNILEAAGAVVAAFAGAALFLFGLLLYVAFLDEGSMVTLASGTGFVVGGALLGIGGAMAALSRLGLVKQGPMDLLRAAR